MNSQPSLQAHCLNPTSHRSSQSFVKELAKPTRAAHRPLGRTELKSKFLNKNQAANLSRSTELVLI